MTHDCDFFVFDLETSGLDKEKCVILEVGFVVLNWDLKEVDRYSSLIKPYYENAFIDDKALEFNRISMKEVQSKGKELKVVLADIVKLAQDSKKRTKKKPILCGHNIYTFDIPFLHIAFKKGQSDLYKNFEEYCLDTLWFSRWRTKESENYQLGTSCQNEGINLTAASGHSALGDVEANANLIRIYLNALRGKGSKGEEKRSRFRDTFQF